MKFAKNRIAAITIAIFLMFSMSASMILIPNANAQTSALNIPTYSFCSVSPNPQQVGQSVNVNFWINEPPPTASAEYGDRWMGMTVLVTLPDGTTTTLGPFTSDDTGGSHTTYTPNAVGNYTLQMSFPGQILAGSNPAPGTPAAGQPGANPFIGDYYEPSTSNTFKITVQQGPIATLPITPLPTTYWTRPIYAENTNWYTIAGNWLGLGPGAGYFSTTGDYNATGNYNPYTTAPTTGHILWTKPEAFGGIIGGEFGGSETSNFYSTSQYEPKFSPIIMDGILYYTMYPGSSTYPSGWAAVDLQTGQTLWTKNTTEVLVCGQILNYDSPNQYGGLAYLWSCPNTAGVFEWDFTASLEMWDAMTGDYILTINNLPPAAQNLGLSLTEDSQGDLIGYYVNSTYDTNGIVTAQSLTMWNSTLCINLAVPNWAAWANGGNMAPDANDWSWRPPLDASINFGLGIQWTAPLAPSLTDGTPIVGPVAAANGLTGLGIYEISSGVVVMYEVAKSSAIFNYGPGWQIEAGYSSNTGAQLWITNRTETPYSSVYGGNTYPGGWWANSGVYVELSGSTLSISGYSLATGNQLWGPTALPNASPFDSLGANAVVANGTIYIWGYGGDVYAYKMLTGALIWQYHTPSGADSPYGAEPLWIFSVGTVAGGIMFVPEGHMYSPPLFHGAQQLALNITNGKLVWSELAFDVTSAPAVSDGIATTLNAYDNQIYAWGMGPSKTTANAQAFGSSMVISGSVTDISSGSQQGAVAANFPNGLPCVSDASMSQFMEAVYMQQPMPTNITGVPVTISVTDSNGNHYNIGTATTNPNGFYSLTWTPTIPGNFTVTATFAGTQSYYGSSANAAFYASAPAPTAAPTTSPVTGLASTATVELGVVAIIIVIVIIGVVLALLMMRKHP